MKQLNIYFEDKEFEELEDLKQEAGLTWRELVLTLLEKPK